MTIKFGLIKKNQCESTKCKWCFSNVDKLLGRHCVRNNQNVERVLVRLDSNINNWMCI